MPFQQAVLNTMIFSPQAKFGFPLWCEGLLANDVFHQVHNLCNDSVPHDWPVSSAGIS